MTKEHSSAPKPATADVDVLTADRASPTLIETALRLQATAGNRATAPLFGVAQAKMLVGATNDPLESEADAFADRVVRTLATSEVPEPSAEPRFVAPPTGIRRRSANGGVGAEGGDVDSETERAIESARTRGQPLSLPVRGRMESAMGTDLGNVRVHTGAESSELGDRLGARAFTIGSDIFFNGQAPDTSTASGQHLLAHELAHTMQQSAVPVAHRSHAPTAGPDVVQRKGKRGGKGRGKGQGKGGPPPKTVAPTKTKKTDEELLTGPMPEVGSPDYQRAIKLRMGAGQKRREQEKQNSSGILGALNSWLPGSWGWSGPTEDEEEDEESDGFENFEGASGEGGENVAEATFGDEEQEEEEGEEEAKSLLDAISPKAISITLSTGKLESTGTRVGDVKGSSSTKVNGGGGVEHGGKLSVEGSKGSGSAEGKLLQDIDGMEGEGKAEFVLGPKGERKLGTLGWDVAGAKVEADGQVEGFAGVKGGVEGKGKYDSKTGDFSGKGKLGGMVGVGSEGTVKVKLNAGGKDLGTVEGKLGIHYGVGGEVFGEIKWKGGTLTFSSGGKVVAGLGFSYSYKVEMNTQSLVDMGTGFLASLWSWMSDTEGLEEEDFWL